MIQFRVERLNTVSTELILKVREPYSVVQFLAERLHIPPLLGLPLHPQDDQV